MPIYKKINYKVKNESWNLKKDLMPGPIHFYISVLK